MFAFPLFPTGGINFEGMYAPKEGQGIGPAAYEVPEELQLTYRPLGGWNSPFVGLADEQSNYINNNYSGSGAGSGSVDKNFISAVVGILVGLVLLAVVSK